LIVRLLLKQDQQNVVNNSRSISILQLRQILDTGLWMVSTWNLILVHPVSGIQHLDPTSNYNFPTR